MNKEATTEKIPVVQQEGTREVRRNTLFYNLDAIISVGYRVNSIRATQFRQWCTYVIRQFSLRGYIIDKKRMENGSFIGEDYFEHLLAEIHEIRLSERRFYQKLTDIYATAVDLCSWNSYRCCFDFCCRPFYGEISSNVYIKQRCSYV